MPAPSKNSGPLHKFRGSVGNWSRPSPRAHTGRVRTALVIAILLVLLISILVPVIATQIRNEMVANEHVQLERGGPGRG